VLNTWSKRTGAATIAFVDFLVEYMNVRLPRRVKKFLLDNQTRRNDHRVRTYLRKVVAQDDDVRDVAVFIDRRISRRLRIRPALS
jgi:hypothetical protein